MAEVFSSITRAGSRLQNAQDFGLIVVMSCIIDIAPGLGTAIGAGHAYIRSGRLRAEVSSLGNNSNSPQVQSISIPAGQHSRITFNHAIAVVLAREAQQVHFMIGCIKESSPEMLG